MGLLMILLFVAALLLGGVGLLVEGLLWLVVIGAILVVAGVLVGLFTRGAAVGR